MNADSPLVMVVDDDRDVLALLLVDLMMPGIDGWGLAARVRDDRTWAFIRSSS